ncbi:MAG: diguanylate cyclase [Sulfurimonas sp.]|jgi:diguanylate cyclase (GGDEF)-like protein|nr:diguanylate cyclase [Sulfurimonadaceae bacterium]
MLLLLVAFYIKYLIDTKDALEEQNYTSSAKEMQMSLISSITKKQTKTMSVALELAQDNGLIHNLIDGDENSNYKDIFGSKSYNNIGHIRVYDKNLHSVYKNWSENLNDDISFNRVDLEYAIKTKTPINTTFVDEHSLSLKSIVPIFIKNSLIGVLELSSEFTEISKELKTKNIGSLVLLNKKYSNELNKPATNIFLGEYYVANYDASEVAIDYIKKIDMLNLLSKMVYKDKNYLISTYRLKDIKDNTIGYYILLKDSSLITAQNIDHFLVVSLLILVIVLLVVALLVSYSMYNYYKTQKHFYKDMIHQSPNIAIIASKDEIIEVNDTFFKYFSDFTTLEEFKKHHKTISEFFAKEGGYMCQDSEDFCWIELVMQNIQENKVKIVLKESFYYFAISASLISKEKGLYYATFRDITKEELYKKELENTNITDTLTKIKNRYFYNLQLESEVANANRYFYPLSLIIFDIDHFKKINDTYGHDIGDKVLIEYTKLINSHIRDSDIFCRIGGEEFAIILPHATKAGAYKLADKLRMVVMEHRVILKVTMSFGVVEYKKGEDLELLFKRADEALYVAKQNGRNKVAVR